MGWQVRPAERGDVPSVVDLLQRIFPGIAPSAWSRIFEYAWMDPPDHGLLAENEDGEIIGFGGAIYSERMVDGRPVTVCAATSWCVREDYRSTRVAHALARAFIRRNAERGIPVVMLTLGEHTMRYFRRWPDFRVFRGFHSVRFPRPWYFLRSSSVSDWIEPSQVTAEEVGSEPFRIMRDHEGLYCRVGVLRIRNEPVVVVTRRRIVRVARPGWALGLKERMVRAGLTGRISSRVADLLAGDVVTSEIVYVSDEGAFRSVLDAAIARIVVRDGVYAVSGDHDLLGLEPPDPGGRQNDYCVFPHGVALASFDALYSEQVLLPLGPPERASIGMTNAPRRSAQAAEVPSSQ